MKHPSSFREAITIDLIDVALIVVPSILFVLLNRTFDLGIDHLSSLTSKAGAAIVLTLLGIRRVLIGWPKVRPKTKARSTLLEIFSLFMGVIAGFFLIVGALGFFRYGGSSALSSLAGGFIGVCVCVFLYRINRQPDRDLSISEPPDSP